MYDSLINLNINSGAIALDNANRAVFYFDNESSIMRGNFDAPFTKKVK